MTLSDSIIEAAVIDRLAHGPDTTVRLRNHLSQRGFLITTDSLDPILTQMQQKGRIQSTTCSDGITVWQCATGAPKPVKSTAAWTYRMESIPAHLPEACRHSDSGGRMCGKAAMYRVEARQGQGAVHVTARCCAHAEAMSARVGLEWPVVKGKKL